ncbi:HNH endonuclease [Sinirhodobacter ferrireducens]|uniref:HNH endonuclease n=1 Tax=Paenirhodobacter ferrireducens TaxID=1215032 RepID=A0A443L7I1_9RHOB|nr:HNH endonuclease signature motif containing protein [Sinirhodobacter ferrireducens]RWR44981.1 HNH endonuclease [Sinirhodobacter ferrireducens]
MPSRAPHICGCGHVVPSGVKCPCQIKRDAERKARFDKDRPSASERGLGADWRKLRARHIRKHPFCVICGAPATDVDHIIPRRVAPERRLDPTNLQSLCKKHHSGAKQREERRKYGMN